MDEADDFETVTSGGKAMVRPTRRALIFAVIVASLFGFAAIRLDDGTFWHQKSAATAAPGQGVEETSCEQQVESVVDLGAVDTVASDAVLIREIVEQLEAGEKIYYIEKTHARAR